MSSMYSYESVFTSEHDLSEKSSGLDDHLIPEVCPQSISDLLTFGIRSAGVLRYNRESDDHRIKLTTGLPVSEPLTEYLVKCDYCGGNAKPPLDLTWAQGPDVRQKTVPPFCCERWLQLWETLVRQRWDLRSGGTTASVEEDQLSKEAEELLIQGREMVDHNKFTMDLRSAPGKQSEPRILEDYTVYQPEAESLPPSSKVLRYQLCPASDKGCWTGPPPGGETEKHFKVEEEEVPLPFCNHRTNQFGICCHQGRSEILQKYYGKGLKCLTVFPDGSAQVFYPSGLLALVVVVTEKNGRVCIVYGDSAVPHQPIRAVFQSDGRATCYHNNGNTWLTLNRSGGQCLDEEGARVRRWSWGSQSLFSAPLKPVFMSLNKAVGVRVLGKEQVFVSFLAGGQQAKFSVGCCCTQASCETNMASSGPSVLKEELFVLAARIRMHLPIQQLHQDLITPSHPRLPKTTKASRQHVLANKLLEVGADVIMSESERDFIHWCLHGYL
ncbi:uncharacterized protein [Labrus bergylta]|uniref:uncharacterized protein n=1 Tax=Labrus bergylta TaxID=56723 RepID=UPI0033139DAE